MEYWILQHNPALLRTGYPHPSGVPPYRDYWHISRYEKDVSVGDTAFIWHAGSARGIYNVATILSVEPHSLQLREQIKRLQLSDDPYFTDPKEKERLRQEPSILIEYHYTGDLHPPVSVAELEDHGFGKLTVIQMWRKGIYRLDPTVGQQLFEYIWLSRKSPDIGTLPEQRE